jgi:tetratricopeptide (TPR) repeat protein
VSIDLLNHATSLEEVAVVQGLDELWQRRVVKDEGQDGYDFNHEKFREVIYHRLSPPRRRFLHQKIGEALESIYGDRTDEIASLLANHYQNAGRQVKAAAYYVVAGDLARQVYANQDAIDFYQRALDLEVNPDNLDIIRLYEGLGEALLRETRYEEASSAYLSLRDAADETEDLHAQARSWLGLYKVQERLGKHQEAFESAEQAVKVAKTAGTEVILASAVLNQGAAKYRLGEASEAADLGEKALQLSKQLKDRFLHARSLNLMGQINDMLGNYPQAQNYKEEALALFEEVQDHRARWWIRSVLLNMANTISLSGNYQRAIALYQEALDTEVEVRDPDWEWICLFNMAWARIENGDYIEAESDLREILTRAAGTGWFGLSMTNAGLANACLKQGKFEDALRPAIEAVIQSRESGAQEFLGAAWRILGRAVSGAGTPVQVGEEEVDARGCFGHSLSIFEEIQAEPEKARTLRAWGMFEIKAGDQDRGRSMWQEAREIFHQLGVTAEVEAMDKEMGTDLPS